MAKANLAAYPTSLAYRVIENTEFDCAAVSWKGSSSHTAEDLTGHKAADAPAPKLEAAKKLLRDALAKGARLRAALEVLAGAEGISWRTVESAKAELGVMSEQRPEPGRQGAGPSWWWLPEAPQDAPNESSAASKDTGFADHSFTTERSARR